MHFQIQLEEEAEEAEEPVNLIKILKFTLGALVLRS